jgi:hypothetical protein
VILSANVFVAPLRAIAVARAAAPRVTVRASPRDPVLANEIVAAVGDPALTSTSDRDVASTEADAIHVYGRDQTVAAVRSRAPAGVVVRGHGAGLGVAIVTGGAAVGEAAEALAIDVVAFDQRGCLSPRLVLIEGDPARAGRFAQALHDRLDEWSRRVPRGTLSADERADAAHWRDSMSFVGEVWRGASHLVAVAPPSAPTVLPPPGRHVLVSTSAPEATASRLAAMSAYLVAVGSDDPARAEGLAPSHVRVSTLGRMQRPPLDGPADRRWQTGG